MSRGQVDGTLSLTTELSANRLREREVIACSLCPLVTLPGSSVYFKFSGHINGPS